MNHSAHSQSVGTVPFSIPNKPCRLTGVVRTDGVDLKTKIKTLEDQYEIGLSNLTHVDQSELRTLVDLLYYYRDAFACSEARIGLFPVDARIPTVPGKSINQPQFGIAEKHQALVDNEITKMLTDGVIERCSDPKGWNSPVFIVEKSDGSPRFIVNFKKTLNMALIEEDTFVMPNADEMLNSIGIGNNYFGSLDFKSGYWQIGLHVEDRHKTSFCWKGRNY